MFSGDNILGVGTTVIPMETGDLRQYMNSLEDMLELRPKRIYPAHGPVIEDGCEKVVITGDFLWLEQVNPCGTGR